MNTHSIKHILVPVDYSVNSKRAAQLAIMMAKNIDAEVYLLHAFGLPAIGVAEGVVLADEIKKDEGRKLNKFLSDLKTEFGEVKLHGILEFGSAVDWIQKVVEDKNIDLVMMGTKGETNAGDVLLGTVASNVIKVVKCAVLIVPTGYKAYNVSEVLFATDYHFTNDSAEIMAPFLHILKEYDPYLHIVQFTTELSPEKHSINSEELKYKELFRNTKHSFHYVETEDVEAGLFQFAEKHHCDLIVMVTRHYNFWERLMHRSLTQKIALHTELPLLILHEK